MLRTVQREIVVKASAEEVWRAITAPGWLADEVELELRPGGEASFRAGDRSRRGWVEDAVPGSRLVFWWALDDEPATRVELALETLPAGTRLRVLETQPLDRLELVGTPLSRTGGQRYGPALVAA